MRSSQLLVIASVVLGLGLACPSTAPAAPPADAFRAVLAARAERPAEPPGIPRAAGLGVGGGRLLFSLAAPNNCATVRTVPDVTGDGVDEVLAGIDESGTDNVLLLDGASLGTATPVWALETTDGASGGSPWGDQPLTAVSDGDGDGAPEILAGTAWGGRTAYRLDALDGSILWKFDTYLEPDSGWVYSLAEMSDTTGDGVPESAFGAGSDNDGLYFVDGASTGQATVLWRYSAADAVISVRNLGDVSGDGDDDVLAAIGDTGRTIVALSGGTAAPGGEVIWSYPTGTASANAVEVIPDVNGDGVADALAVLWVSGGGAIRCLDGRTGALLWASTQVAEFGMMVDPLPDVTGDGKAEVVVSSWENAVILLNGATGAQVWKTPVGTLNGGDVWTARAAGDLDGDGQEDVAAGSFDGHVYALDGPTGQIFWAYDTGNRVFSVHPVGDLDADGRPEIAAGTQDTTSSTVVYVLDGDGGLLFGDGFESGDLSAWSAAVP